MVHDGFASYDRFAKAIHQQCLGHVLRRVRELEAKATRGAVHYPRRLIALLTEAIHLRNRHSKDGLFKVGLRRCAVYAKKTLTPRDAIAAAEALVR